MDITVNAATATVLSQCVIVVYVSVTVCNVTSSKATTMLHVNVMVCNAAAIMLLLLCVSVVHICIFYCM